MSYYTGAHMGVNTGSIGEIVSWRFIHRDKSVKTVAGDGPVLMVKELNLAEFSGTDNDFYTIEDIKYYCTLANFNNETYSAQIQPLVSDDGHAQPPNVSVSQNTAIVFSAEEIADTIVITQDMLQKMTVVTTKIGDRLYFRKYTTQPIFNYVLTEENDNLEAQLHAYTVKLTPKTPMGWLGNPSAVREKSNNNDAESFILEVVTETPPNTVSGGSIVHTLQPHQFFSIDIVRRMVHTAVSHNIEDMIRRYNRDQQSLFKSLREQDIARIQTVFERALNSPLTTIHNSDGSTDTTGGYHLLQDARITPKKRKSVFRDKDNESRTLYKLMRVNEAGEPVQQTSSTIARTLKDLVVLPTIYEDAPMDMNALFTDIAMPTQTDLENEDNMLMIGHTPQPYMVQPYLKPKINLLNLSRETTDTIASTAQVGYHANSLDVDTPATQFEHDMAIVTNGRLTEEIHVFIRLLVSCFMAQTNLQSPKQMKERLQVRQAPHFPVSTTSVDNPTWGKSTASMFGGTYTKSNKVYNERGDATVVVLKEQEIPTNTEYTLYGEVTMDVTNVYALFRAAGFNSVYYLYVEGLKSWTAENQFPPTWKPPLFPPEKTDPDNVEQIMNISMLATMYRKYTLHVRNVTRIDLNTIQFEVYFIDGDTTYMDTKQITYNHTGDTMRSIHSAEGVAVMYIGVVRKQSDVLDTIKKVDDENALEMGVWEINTRNTDDDVIDVLETYINKADPWRGEDDNEYTACSALLWEKCRQHQAVPNTADMNALGILLSTTTPFGALTPKMQQFADIIHHQFTENPNLYGKSGEIQYMTLTAYKDTHGILPDVLGDETPEVVFEIKAKEDGGIKWALGCESNLLLEALHVLLLYFNVLIKETLETEGNRLEEIKKREALVGWDTYPCGLFSVVHTNKEKSYFSTVTPSADLTMGSVRPVESSHGDMVYAPKIHKEHNKLREQLFGMELKSGNDDLQTFYRSCYPGTPLFIAPRSWIRKEIVYRDSEFTAHNLECAASRNVDDVATALHYTDKKRPSVNKWSGLAMYTKSTTNQYPQASVYFLSLVDRARHATHLIYDIKWTGAPIYNASGVHVHDAYSGLGAWNMSPDTSTFDIHQLKTQRYRGYTGATPIASSVVTREQQWSAPLIGPNFSTSIKTERYIIPEITLYTDGNTETNQPKVNKMEVLGKWLVDGFMGWHHSTTQALNRTVSAVLVHTEMRRLIKVLNTPKTENPSEPRAYSIKFSPGKHLNMATFVYALYKGAHKKSVGFVRSNPLVIPSMVIVKGPTDTAVPTRCIVDHYYETTGMYDIICRTAASKLRMYTPSDRSRIPSDALNTSLVARLFQTNRQNSMHTLFDYVSFHPAATTDIVKLCNILHTLQGVDSETQKYRENSSLIACKFGVQHLNIHITFYKVCHVFFGLYVYVDRYGPNTYIRFVRIIYNTQ